MGNKTAFIVIQFVIVEILGQVIFFNVQKDVSASLYIFQICWWASLTTLPATDAVTGAYLVVWNREENETTFRLF